MSFLSSAATAAEQPLFAGATLAVQAIREGGGSGGFITGDTSHGYLTSRLPHAVWRAFEQICSAFGRVQQ